MSKIDRRTVALGLLVMPLTGCPEPDTATLAKPQAYPQPIIRNYGYWTNSSTYVVTGGVKP